MTELKLTSKHTGSLQPLIEGAIGQLMIEDENLKLLVFDDQQEVILQWKN